MSDQKNYQENEQENYHALSINLSDSQLAVLKQLLAPSASCEDDPNYELLCAIEHADHVAKHFGNAFINVYEIAQHYGGPEEGGWYYHVATLLDSEMCATADTLPDCINRITDAYLGKCIEEESYNELLKQMDAPAWDQYGCIIMQQLDQYGQGIVIGLEPTIGLSDDSDEPRYYC